MNQTIQIAPVRKSVVVFAAPERAFEVFTARIDSWWPKSHGIGAAPIRESVLEGFVGGRWYTTFEDGTEATVGHVLAWEPGRRLVVTWEINEQWKSDARQQFASEVEVRFSAEADGHTRVELEHRNFERMGAAAGETMRKGVDGGWVGLLQLFANAVK
ncbi:MAG: SRPBCC family protein [Gammaproteobacteria bacterium]